MGHVTNNMPQAIVSLGEGGVKGSLPRDAPVLFTWQHGTPCR